MSVVRSVIDWARFTPENAGWRSILIGSATVPLLNGVSRAYEAESVGTVVTQTEYETVISGFAGVFDAAMYLGVVLPLLGVSDAIGRAWYVYFGGAPEPMGWAIALAPLLAYFALVIDFGWHTVLKHREFFEQGGSA